MLKNLLMYRLLLLNSSLISLMVYFWFKGYVPLVLAGDPTGISLGIIGLFIITGLATVGQAWKVSRDKNAFSEGRLTSKAKAKRAIKLKRIMRAGHIMALLGIIGTVTGFIIAFAGTDMAAMNSAADVSAGVFTMLKGMGVALYTTLVGSVLGGWTDENYHMLQEQVDTLEVDET